MLVVVSGTNLDVHDDWAGSTGIEAGEQGASANRSVGLRELLSATRR